MGDQLKEIVEQYFGRDDFMIMLFDSLRIIWLGTDGIDQPKSLITFFHTLIEMTYHQLDNPIELAIPTNKTKREFLNDLDTWIRYMNLFTGVKYGGSIAYRDFMLFLYLIRDALDCDT